MTSITLTGALSLISTNGDGPQMLTEAAEFVAALAQMGVIVGVEINLRPVVAEKPAPAATLRGYTTAEAAAPAPQIEPPANPQTPPLREAGETRPDLSASMNPDERWLHGALDAGDARWLKLAFQERTQMIQALGHSMTLFLGRTVKMGDWDKMRPTWAPSASALPITYAPSWKALTAQWNVELAGE